MIQGAILYVQRSKLVDIEGSVALYSFKDTIFNTKVATYILHYSHMLKAVLVSQLFVYAILLIPTLRCYTDQLFLRSITRQSTPGTIQIVAHDPDNMPPKKCAAIRQVLIEEWYPCFRQSSTDQSVMPRRIQELQELRSTHSISTI